MHVQVRGNQPSVPVVHTGNVTKACAFAQSGQGASQKNGAPQAMVRRQAMGPTKYEAQRINLPFEARRKQSGHASDEHRSDIASHAQQGRPQMGGNTARDCCRVGGLLADHRNKQMHQSAQQRCATGWQKT